MRTLEELLKLAPDLYDITVFGAEPHPNYNRIMLSPVLAGEQTVEEIVLNESRLVCRATASPCTPARGGQDRPQDSASSWPHDGTGADYDRLLLATGSDAVHPAGAGRTISGVVGFRDIDDVDAMIARVQQYKHAVVIGGGLLGLEAANGLKLRGMDVTVVHIGRLADGAPARRTGCRPAAKEPGSKGLKFLLREADRGNCSGEAGRVAAVQLQGRREIPADLVVMAVGIRPNTALAESAGLHCERGIVVNDTMQTFDPRIYAVGECVQPPRRGLRPGRAAVRAGQGLPPTIWPKHGIGPLRRAR